MPTQNRIYLWDNLKVILMMLVVITHSANVYQLQGEKWIQYIWCFTMTYTMPLFTIISGFWYKERTIWYSIKRYLYPCVLFSIINYAGGGISGAYPDGIPLKAGWAMWYLWSLFIYSIITPRIVNRIGIKCLMLLSLLIAFLLGFKFINNNVLDAQRVVNFYPFYVFGIILRKYEMNIYSERIRKKLYGHYFSLP